MNEELPEDITKWPTDPYLLLGVEPPSDSRALRQAYTRLIRRFKPEHAPEQFRRIREAYETVLQHLEFRQRFARFEAASPTDSSDAPSTTEGRPASDRPEPRPTPEPAIDPAPSNPRRHTVRFKSIAEQLDELWQQVCAAEPAIIERIYQRICQLQQEHPAQSAIYIRLYWLLRLAPDVDRQRAPADWLLAGLARCSQVWGLRELCRAELERDPNLAFRAEFNRLLTNESLDASALEDLLIDRWRAAVRLDRAHMVAEDLSVLRGRWSQSNEVLWSRLLMRAAERLLWSTEATSWLMHDIDALPHFQVNLAAELDNIDYLRQIAFEYRRLRPMDTDPDRALERLVSVWQQPSDVSHRMLLALAGDCARLSQENVLRFFDGVNANAPTLLAGVLARLGFAASDEPAADDERDPKALEEHMANFLGERPGITYLTLRSSLLRFCISEAIDPMQFVSLIAPVPVLCIRREENLSLAISGDTALRCAYALAELISD